MEKHFRRLLGLSPEKCRKARPEDANDLAQFVNESKKIAR
jgi:hypothetical protein